MKNWQRKRLLNQVSRAKEKWVVNGCDYTTLKGCFSSLQPSRPDSKISLNLENHQNLKNSKWRNSKIVSFRHCWYIDGDIEWFFIVGHVTGGMYVRVSEKRRLLYPCLHDKSQLLPESRRRVALNIACQNASLIFLKRVIKVLVHKFSWFGW